MKKSPGLFWTLFSSTFLLSAFTVGGGFVIVPLMRKKFVEELGWIDQEEMLDLVAISQSSPGPIAVNAAILVGYRAAGLAGAFTAMVGTVLPPLLIITVISFFYMAFQQSRAVAAVLWAMRAGVGAVILEVVIHMGWDIVKSKKVFPIAIMVGAFVAATFFSVDTILVIVVSGLLGMAIYTWELRQGGGER